jgi:hypothetical protein
MTPQTYNFIEENAIKRGTLWERVLYWKNPDGTPVDLTGFGAQMDIRKRQGSTLIARLDTDDASIVFDELLGKMTLRMPPSVSSTIAAGSYAYDYLVRTGVDSVYALLQGEIEVQPTITDIN